MYTQFGKNRGWSAGRCNSWDSMCTHLSRWAQEYDKQLVWMHIHFAMGGTINKNVLVGKMCDLLLKLERQNVEKVSAQMVIHVEAFKKVCEAINKVCNVKQSDWHLHVPIVLWAYRVTCKKLTGRMPSRMVYEVSAKIMMKYIMPSLCIAAPVDTIDCEALKEGNMQLEEEGCLGLDEEIQWGNVTLQEFLNEKAHLREKNSMEEEEVQKLEGGMKRDFLDKRTVVIKWDAHDCIDKFEDYL